MDNITTPDTFAYLFAAYTAIWAIIVVYLALLGKRISQLESKLTRKE